MSTTRRSRTPVTAVALVAAAALVAMSGPAQAAVNEPPRPAFYETPATLPAANGDLIRHERMTFTLDPLDVTSTYQDSRRVLYKSTNRAGEAIAVSGSVLVPKTPWLGSGPRPIIGYAAGTQGMADKCAPSRQFSEGVEYEGMFMDSLLKRGYAIAMTDYESLGTEGVHTYMDRVSQGRAVLDSVRAAQRLGIAGVNANSPVGLTGYSQGGGATAAAAELAASYAPELKIKGAVMGAVPADLAAVAKNLDGTMYSAFSFFAIRGLAESYGVDISPYLNAKGIETMQTVENSCVFDLFSTAFVKSETLSADGRPLTVTMDQAPFKDIVEAQRLGTIKPSMPVLVNHSALDDTIPYAQGKAMAKSWCTKGANVRFETNLGPMHVGGMPIHAVTALTFFEYRFAGLPQLSNCWLI